MVLPVPVMPQRARVWGLYPHAPRARITPTTLSRVVRVVRVVEEEEEEEDFMSVVISASVSNPPGGGNSVSHLFKALQVLF